VATEYGVPERGIYNYDRTTTASATIPDIDIVYVCLPVSMHAEYTIRAAKAGKHVLCEKPMALSSSAECESMIAACKQAGKKLMIGYRCHFEPTNLEARRRARAGEIGKLRYFRSEHGFVQGNPSTWRLKKAMSGGGSIDGHRHLRAAGGALHDERGTASPSTRMSAPTVPTRASARSRT
jgi:predicted dehydrogenase